MKICRLLIVALLWSGAVLQAAEGERQLRNLAGVPEKERNPVALDDVWPETVGDAAVCLWKDDKVGSFTLTIDDNLCWDHDWWLEQGKKYGFHFTWFAITDRIGKENPAMNGTWANFQKLVDQGHDVQSHSASHRHKDPIQEDYALAIEQINKNLTGTRCLALAYPGGQKQGTLPNDPAVAASLYAGARGGPSLPGKASPPDYFMISSISGTGSALLMPGEKGSWASILGLVDKSTKFPASYPYRGWYCVHMHSVGTDKQREETVKSVTALFDYVKKNEDKIWAGLFREVLLYCQERDTASLQVLEATPAQIRMQLSDRMYDEWYNFPLTVKVRVPDHWTSATGTQAGAAVATNLVNHGAKKYLLVQAVPDRGEVMLRPGN